MHFMTQFSFGQAELGRELLAGAAGPELDLASLHRGKSGGHTLVSWKEMLK